MSTPDSEDLLHASSVLDRVAEAMEFKTDTAMASAFGVQPQTVYGWRSRNSLPFRDIIDLAERYQLNLDYLLTGKGAAKRPEHWGYSEIATSELHRLRDSCSTSHVLDDFDLVPVYGVELAAGVGRIPEDERVVRHHAYHSYYFRKWGLAAKDCCVVRISGDSMNDLLFDGDHGLVHMAERNVISGKAYAFRMGEELLVKYLQRLPNGNLQASSHNHAQYPPFEISKSDLGSDVEIIGRLRDHNHRWD